MYSEGPVTTHTIQDLLVEVRRLLAEYHEDESQWFSHPDFGEISSKDTIRIIAIHIRHHLKIIHDILNTK